jgi:DNA-binding CsgD family transcriptional regulator
VLELDREGRVVDANPTFRRCVPGIVGRQATVAMTRVDALRHAPLWQELVQGTLARYEITATLRRPDGTTVPGRVVVTAVVGADGEVTGAVAVTLPDAAPTASAAAATPRRDQPTAAEIAVLTGLASGLTLQQVAARLGLTRRGVDYRLARLRQKLRADGPGGTTVPATTAGVVARGYALGLLTPGTWPPRPS